MLGTVHMGVQMSDAALQMRGPVGGTTDAKKVAVGSSVGAVIETYDFIGFGTAAALYFGTAFFPVTTRSPAPWPRSRRWASASPLDQSAASWVDTSVTGWDGSRSWSPR